MEYQVTARKWRPQTFAELIGQEHVARTLQNALRQGRVAHAYLFAGMRGVGKTTTARILAKALNCERGPTPDPCNQCPLCQAITVGSALDVLEIDGASNRGIDEIRDLRERIRYAPARSRYKIYIIDEVHMLTEHAFNALLKTLEEPPPQVVFIFATTEPQKVPVTILSRCQRFDFRKVASQEIAACLGHIAEREGVRISAAALHRIARRAEGSVRDAQTLFDQVVAYGGPDVRDDDVLMLLGLVGEEQLLGLLQALLEHDARAVLEKLSHLLQHGHDARELCRQLLEYLRDLIVVKVASPDPRLLDRWPAEVESLQKLSEQTSVEELHTLFELLSATEARLRESVQPIWTLEVALMKLASLPRWHSLEALIARLEALEHRLAGGPEGSASAPSSPVALGRTAVSASASSGAAASAATTVAPAPPRSALGTYQAAAEPGPAAPDLAQKLIASAGARSLGWILEQHCRIQLRESTLEIVFRGHNRMARELLQEAETQRTLHQIAQQIVGREIAVRIIDTPEPNGDGQRAASHEPRAEEAPIALAQTPVVREAIEVFGGRVVDVRRRTASREFTERALGAEGMLSEEESDDE
jgi:DNA polymerase-3 subunit gamma/tau